MTVVVPKAPWTHPSDAPVIEQSIHDYIVSIFRMQPSMRKHVEIIPISPAAEATRGWDAAVMEAVPLYFQYKLPDYTHSPHRTQKAAFAKRQQWGFDDAAGLFHFYLREKAPSAPRSQHALLVDMQNQGERVFYVAPTFIDLNLLRFGGDLLHGRAWLPSHVTITNWNVLERINVPLFDNLICIPPFADVDGAPEDHQFFFNLGREVSLHSEPAEVDAQTMQQVLDDQIAVLNIRRDGVITNENYREYTERVLQSLSGGEDGRELRGAVSEYFESRLARGEVANRNPMMRHLRTLAKVVKKLAGLDMLLTLRREV